jgi:uncharacterized protein (TIGR02996 family)
LSGAFADAILFEEEPMTSNTRDAIFRAILDEPDEVAHRLVYADWLEENGTTETDRARADLIHVQIARETADPDGDEYWHLRARERALLAGWYLELASALPNCVQRYRYRRGFVEWVELGFWDAVRQAPSMREVEPVRGVALVDRAEDRGEVSLDRFRDIDLGAIHPAGASCPRWLLRGPLDRLEINPRWWPVLRDRFRDGPTLRHLGIGGIWPEEQEEFLSLGQMRELVVCPVPHGLRSFSMRGTEEAEAFTAFVESPWLVGLEQLTLEGITSEREPTLSILSRHSSARNLLTLSLFNSPSLENLRRAGTMLAGLRRLHLDNRFRVWHRVPRFLRDLGMSDLRELTLAEVSELPEDAPLLREWHCWPRLQSLELQNAARGVSEDVLAGPYLTQLRRMELSHLPPGGFPESHGPLPLIELRLSGGVPTSVRDIARSRVLPHLASLEMGNAHLDDPADLAGLLDPACFPRLVWLDLHGVKVPEAWQARAQERLGRGVRFRPHPTRTPGDDLVYEG